MSSNFAKFGTVNTRSSCWTYDGRLWQILAIISTVTVLHHAKRSIDASICARLSSLWKTPGLHQIAHRSGGITLSVRLMVSMLQVFVAQVVVCNIVERTKATDSV